MIRDKYERTLKQFETYYPRLCDRTIDWWASGRMSITVKLDNGVLYDYDPMDNSIRQVYVGDVGEADETVFRKDFGANLQKMIPYSGLSKSELAAKVGITNAMLSRYIRGNSTPSVTIAYKIARALGCLVDELFADTYTQ